MKYDLIQPWSVPVLKTSLPPKIHQTMIEITDQIIADKETKSWGEHLVGQIDTELLIKHNILEKTGVLDFFIDAVSQFVFECRCQMYPYAIEIIQRKKRLIKIISMWIVSQQPGEYNPLHVHAGCQISSVMYLKVPKMLPSRKEHKPFVDGSILFTSNSSTDIDLSIPHVAIPPQVGDFYIFGAHQQHAVYPFRCEEGQEDTERRSISFNAAFQSKTDYE